MVKLVESNHISYRFAPKTLKRLPEVLTLYYGREMTVLDVSKELNMSPTSVSKLLNVYGKGMRKYISSPIPKLTKYDVKEIRVTFDMVRSDPKYAGKPEVIYRKLAVEYGVMPACIYRIIKRETWKDI